MKFRGKMVDLVCIRQFTCVISFISRLTKSCVIRITLNKLFFMVSDSAVTVGAPKLWAELDQSNYFNEYNMEGVSDENNEIFLQLEPDKLARMLLSLKSSHTAKSLKIKLTRKHSPCLTLEVELPSLSASSCFVVHDVPVSVIPRRLWNIYKEPIMPDFNVSLYLPPLKQVKHVLERMKALSHYLTVSANTKGTMVLSVNTDTVDVSTYFKHLCSPSVRDANETTDRECGKVDEFTSVVVDIRKLLLFIYGDQINPSNVICNIAKNRMVHLFLLHDDITLQYFLPAVTTL